MLAAMQAIPAVTETQSTGFNFTLFTGDLTAHDPDNQYSRYMVWPLITAWMLIHRFCRAFVEQAQVSNPVQEYTVYKYQII